MIHKNHLQDILLVFKTKHKNKLKLLDTTNLSWKSKPRVLCLVCGTIFNTRIDALKSGTGCRVCGVERAKKTVKSGYKQTTKYKKDLDKKSKQYKKTHKQYVSEILEKYGSTLSVIGKYKGCHEKIDHKCNIHNVVWSCRPDKLMSPKRKEPGCPECRRSNQASAKIKPRYLKLTCNPDYLNFRQNIIKMTNSVYLNYKKLINPNNLIRKYDKFQLDHIYSVSEAFLNPKGLSNPVQVQEVCHPANLQMLTAKQNRSKSSTSSYSVTELRRRIREWNKKYGNPFIVSEGIARLRDPKGYLNPNVW